MSTQAPIARVTLHTNGALVVRRLLAEPGEVTVTDLPLLFSSDSLRLRAGQGVVLDVEETCSLESAPAPEPPDEEKVEALAREDSRLRDRLQTLQAAARAWESVVPGEPGKQPPEGAPDPAAWLDAHARGQERLIEIEGEIAVVEKERKRVARESKRLMKTTQGDTSPPRFTRGVRFQLDAEKATDVEIEYFVTGARWAPTYTLSLDGGQGQLTTHALVAQATGEDWSGAELLFSTADLARESTLPELQSWRMGRAQAPRRPAFRPLPGDLNQLFVGWDHDQAHGGGGGPPSPPVLGGMRSGITEPEMNAYAADGAMLEDDYDKEEDLDYEDVDDFEDEMTSEMSMDIGAGDAAYEMREEMVSESSAPPQPAMMARSAMAPPAAAPRGMRMKKSRPAPGGGGGRAVQMAPPEPLPPRLRYAYMRVNGADEYMRGQLHQVAPLLHLHSLITDHDTDNESLGNLERAIYVLREAANRVMHRSPPSGARAVATGHFHHVFTAPGAHDIPTDGSWHRVVVEDRQAGASIDFRCVPREHEDVYRFCTLATPAGSPLLNGPLNVYEDGAFRVTSRVAGSGAGEKLLLNLGTETAVRMTGRTAELKQEEKGLVSQTSKVTHTVTTALRSSLAAPAQVIVYDRLPVTDEDEKDIEVRLLAAEPGAIRDDKDPRGEPLDGGIHFIVELPPGEKRDVLFSYEIALPAKAEIVGGNRRE